jgi:uncharacterized damage-inducible protein DinB
MSGMDSEGSSALMQTHFAMFARYNEWANRRVYDCAGRLSDLEFHADRGAFFGSVCNTLNHILVADRIWLARFTGEGPTYSRLDLILHEDFSALRREREGEDQRITAWIDTLDDARLGRTFTYVPVTEPKQITQPLGPALSHLFNHQTHHRGQVHALLTAIGGRAAAVPLDLMHFQRETGLAAVT